VFINPPKELAEQINRHVESCRRTAATPTMAVFVLPKFNELTRHYKLYQEFPARTQLFIRQSLDDPTQQEVVALTPWHVQLWLAHVDCASYDPTLPIVSDELTWVRVPLDDMEESIATMNQFSPKAAAIWTEARPLIRIDRTVENPDGG
jgi:hypothetical protein